MTRPDEDLRLPDPLAGELRSLFAPPAFPAMRDGPILAAARSAGRINRARRWRLPASIGIAAALAIAATLMWLPHRGAAPGYARTGDIRDAFYLARHLQKHDALEGSAWDANHDGLIDEKDVQSLAMAAVKVTPTGSRNGGLMP